MEKQLKTSESQRKAANKWKAENRDLYKRIPLDMKIEDYNRIKDFADSNGLKINTLIKDLLNREIAYPALHLLDMITQDQYQELTRITQQNNTTVNDLISSAVTKYIDKYNQV